MVLMEFASCKMKYRGGSKMEKWKHWCVSPLASISHKSRVYRLSSFLLFGFFLFSCHFSFKYTFGTSISPSLMQYSQTYVNFYGRFQALFPNSFILFERSALLETSSFDGSDILLLLYSRFTLWFS